MKVLLITNTLYPNLNANSEIVYRIAELLHNKYNCEIYLMGYISAGMSAPSSPNYVKDTFYIESHLSRSVFLNKCVKILNPLFKENNTFRKCFKLFLNPKLLYYYIKYKLCSNAKIDDKEYYNYLKKLLKNNKFDLCVGFAAPQSAIKSLYKINTDTPKIYYKLDILFVNADKTINYELFQKEVKYDSEADAIIVTQFLYSEYLKSLNDKSYINKIYPLEFPNIIRHTISYDRQTYDKKHINCVFTGSLYNDIRNPSYTLNLFCNLIKKIDVQFHIYGHLFGCDDIISKIESDKIIYHGSVGGDNAIACMQQADILVNIGNTVLNQLPSKILTYISLGKPILNIIKNPECPTLKYTNKYPCALNVLETDEVLQSDVDRVLDFITANKGKEIPFEEIKSLYPECTQEYVGDRVYEIIEKVIKEKNKANR